MHAPINPQNSCNNLARKSKARLHGNAKLPTVFISRANETCWLVSDESLQRGGVFRDEKSALTFIRRDIGENVVVRVLQGSTESSNVSHLDTIFHSQAHIVGS